MWGVSEDDVFNAARMNTETKGCFRVPTRGLPEDIFIALSNQPSLNAILGASVICTDAFKRFVDDKFDGEVYIIPSSVHEVLVLPADAFTPVEALREIIRDVNSHLQPEYILSDNPYVIRDGKISIAA